MLKLPAPEAYSSGQALCLKIDPVGFGDNLAVTFAYFLTALQFAIRVTKTFTFKTFLGPVCPQTRSQCVTFWPLGGHAHNPHPPSGHLRRAEGAYSPQTARTGPGGAAGQAPARRSIPPPDT